MKIEPDRRLFFSVLLSLELQCSCWNLFSSLFSRIQKIQLIKRSDNSFSQVFCKQLALLSDVEVCYYFHSDMLRMLYHTLRTVTTMSLCITKLKYIIHNAWIWLFLRLFCGPLISCCCLCRLISTTRSKAENQAYLLLVCLKKYWKCAKHYKLPLC